MRRTYQAFVECCAIGFEQSGQLPRTERQKMSGRNFTHSFYLSTAVWQPTNENKRADFFNEISP